jgi:hypothetical protein
MSARIFVTHSHHDIEFARRLCSDLTARSLQIWFDDTTLRGGERLAEAINRGLAWCDVYLPIVSRASLASTWCWEEMNAAIALSNRATQAQRLRIIPVLAEDCLDEMPPSLLSRLYFNLAGRYDDWLQELLQKGFGITVGTSVAGAALQAPAAPPAPSADARIQRFQVALQRLYPSLRALEDGGLSLTAAVSETARLVDRWRGQVSDQELVRRLEGLSRINDLAIAARTHLGVLTDVLVYSNPQIGVGAGNIGEAVSKYRRLVAEASAGTGWADSLLLAVQQQTFLPKESIQSLSRAINGIRTQVNLIKTETAKLGQI